MTQRDRHTPSCNSHLSSTPSSPKARIRSKQDLFRVIPRLKSWMLASVALCVNTCATPEVVATHSADYAGFRQLAMPMPTPEIAHHCKLSRWLELQDGTWEFIDYQVVARRGRDGIEVRCHDHESTGCLWKATLNFYDFAKPLFDDHSEACDRRQLSASLPANLLAASVLRWPLPDLPVQPPATFTDRGRAAQWLTLMWAWRWIPQTDGGSKL